MPRQQNLDSLPLRRSAPAAAVVVVAESHTCHSKVTWKDKGKYLPTIYATLF